MSKQICVPDEVYERAERLANLRHVAVEDFIAAALADQMAAQDWMARRAARSSEQDFLWALDQAPDVPPAVADQ